MQATHRMTQQIEAALPNVLNSPQDYGLVQAIVIRPKEDERESMAAAHFSPELGVEGDRWVDSGQPRLPDGRPDPRSQVSLMNARLLKLLAGSEERMALAGDNLVVDLDLSATNLPVGQRLAIGTVLLEITDIPHTGCSKFAERFGPDATRFVNAREYKSLHLRGRYARVLRAGTVQVGDAVHKVMPEEAAP
ncbi:MAG: MOSC domain-containing protein [Anaerolineae bacterium]